MRTTAFSIALTLVACSDNPGPAGPPGPAGGAAKPAAPLPPQQRKPVDTTPLPPLASDPGGGTGAAQWAASLGGLGIDAPRGLAIGESGEVYVAGYVEGLAELGALKHDAGAKSDVYVAKLTPDGAIAWAKAFGSARDDTARGVAVHGKTVLVGGNFTDTIKLGEYERTSSGNDDAFVAAFDTDGNPKWLWSAGGVDSDGVNAVAATPDGGWIVAGSFTDTATFGDHALKATGGTDAMLLKLDAGGTVEWIRQFGGAYPDSIQHVVVDARGSIIVQGAFRDKASWGGGELVAGGGSDEDVVLAKYDSNGDHVWSKRFGSQFDDVPGGVAVDRSGNITIAGAFEKTISFGEGDTHSSTGDSDVFVARFTPDGTFQWAHTFGGERPDVGFGIAADAAGNAVVTGWFEGTADFGKGAQTSKGNKDAFAVKLDAAGKVVWAQIFGDKDHDQGRVVAMDPAGRAVVAGLYRFTLAIAPTAIESRRADGDRVPKPDTFIVRFDR